MDVFRVRINCIDCYQATPTQYDPPLRKDWHLLDASQKPKVPVIRVFGSTETGQKVCAHVHGLFPYLYVEYDGPLDALTVSEYIYKFHLSIDRALAIHFRRLGDRKSESFVARITLVKGVPFYGFHVGYRFYLKIYMLNPLVMSRLVDFLHRGLIMGRKFQPYEAHLQYLLQVMVDYNLYGCDYLEAAKVTFRAPVPVPVESGETSRLWDSTTIPPELVLDRPELPRISHCSIEVDVCAQDILNRYKVQERRLHHDFIERERPFRPDMKLVHSMAELWKDEEQRRRKKMGKLDQSASPFPPEAFVSMSAGPRHSDCEGWIQETQYREAVQEMIARDPALKEDGEPFSFSNYVTRDPEEERIQTVFQSVEDFFPEKSLSALGLEHSLFRESSNLADNIQVDEKGILELEIGEEERELVEQEVLLENQRETGAVPEVGFVDQKTCYSRSIATSDSKEINQTETRHSSEHHARNLVETLKREIPKLNTGFGISGMCSRKRPSGSTSQLVMQAKLRELISNRDQKGRMKETCQPKLKRPAPEELNGLVKKLRFEEGYQTEKYLGKPVPNGQSLQTVEMKNAKPFIPNPQRPSQKRQQVAKAKRFRNQTLSFPVVKNPYDPTTLSRLSQRSDLQKTHETGIGKSVLHSPQLSRASLLLSSQDSTKSPTQFLKPKPLYWQGSRTMYLFSLPPPSASEVATTMTMYGLPDVLYLEAHYSNDKDVPPREREHAGRDYRLDGNSILYLPDFDPSGQSSARKGLKPESGPNLAKIALTYQKRQRDCSLRSWEIADLPPSFAEVKDWLDEQHAKINATTRQAELARKMYPGGSKTNKSEISQITGPTPKRFKYSQNQVSKSVQRETQYMSTMSLEIHVNTREHLLPDPEEDEVQCIFWCLKSDEQCFPGGRPADGILAGIIVLSENRDLVQQIRSQTSVDVLEEPTELDLLTRMVAIVRTLDPDILTGYEVHGSSWGYLMERAMHKYQYDLCTELSRVKSQSSKVFRREQDNWGFKTTSTIHVTGRHTINIWRAMRAELNLLQYDRPNVAWHLLHVRLPHYKPFTLTKWYRSGRSRDFCKFLRYYLKITRMNLDILDASELIPRTCEQARLLGVDFFSVFSRGSQFKVESIMFRIAKPENFVIISPSKKQVGSQNALECLPLVMEPQSGFYSSPLLVLDFQSLYPSVMIAYNYCYSTFLGRIVSWRGTNKMGFTEYKRGPGLLRLLKDHITIAPNNMLYAKPNIRRSLLAKMLTEILETRVMVKSGMKQDKDDKALQKLLNNRQLALKLLANVTYGYASASFSGRCPCAELADSIVLTGRETLERAIAYIHSVERWGAEVVYGDTDSLFVHLKGRRREQAFQIGAEIAKDITNMNPRPVKLKFEKVYHPCILVAKKRYVGYKYDSPDQTVPEFDAKGIETVRRDGFPAQQKIVEKALKILFETADLSRVKSFFQAQCSKIMRSAVSVSDFCFAREVKLGTYSTRGPGPPGAVISTRRMLEDARAEPQYGERIPYVVISGPPGSRLIDRCVTPEELLSNPHATLDADYYIAQLIPPLERIFGLVGANVRSWYDEMPKFQLARRFETLAANPAAPGRPEVAGNHDNNDNGNKMIEWFMPSTICISCNVKMTKSPAVLDVDQDVDRSVVNEGEEPLPLCNRCASDPPSTMAVLQTRLNAEQRKYADVVRVCQSCAGLSPLEVDEDGVPCENKGCPVFYKRVKQRARLGAEKTIIEQVVRRLGAKAGHCRKNRGCELDW